METMPYQPHAETGHKVFPPAAMDTPSPVATVTTTNWQAGVPVLQGERVTLRELQLSDAPSLLALLTTEEVARFISPPPTTLDGFERFIAWTHRQRQAGQYVCFAVVPEGTETAIGIFQLRALEPGFGTAEWGFALGSPYWGRGIFADGATEVLAFAFEIIGVQRLEARSSVENLRGNGALRKMGAVCEGTLRQSFLKDGRRHDQHLWTLLESDWWTRGVHPSVPLPQASATEVPLMFTASVH
jgi:[ribosomal protein S5]-alanine N-acetyltransferase